MTINAKPTSNRLAHKRSRYVHLVGLFLSAAVALVVLPASVASAAGAALSVPAQSPNAVLSTGVATYTPIGWSSGTPSDHVALTATGLPSGATFSDTADGSNGCVQESTAGAYSFTGAKVTTSAVALGTYSFTVTATEYSSSTCTGTPTLTASGTAVLVVKFVPSVMVSGASSGAPGAAIPATSINSVISSSSTSPAASGTITFSVFGPQSTPPTVCTSGAVTVGTATVTGNGTYSSSVGFTPSAIGDYWWYASYSGDTNNAAESSTCGTGMSELIVSQGAPTVTWTPPASIAYGTPLSATQLDATASVPGTFVYTPPAGTILPAGPQTLQVVFTPSDTSDYSTITTTVLLTVTASSVPAPQPTTGYLVTTSSGTVYAYGQAAASGDVSVNPATRPIVAIGKSPSTAGYYLVTSLGNVYNEGGAPFFGSKAATKLASPISAFAATPDGKGYWLAEKNGTVYAFGDAVTYSSITVNAKTRPVVAMASSADGKGYYLVTSLGNVYNEGDAVFYGSKAAVRLPHPIIGFAINTNGKGYDLVSSGGNVWNLGGAPFFGSKSQVILSSPVTAFTTTLDGGGYYLMSKDGQLYSYGDAVSYGSPSVSGSVAVSAMAIPA